MARSMPRLQGEAPRRLPRSRGSQCGPIGPAGYMAVAGSRGASRGGQGDLLRQRRACGVVLGPQIALPNRENVLCWGLCNPFALGSSDLNGPGWPEPFLVAELLEGLLRQSPL